MTKRRAAIYARVSSDRQAGEDRVSLAEQVREMERFCQRAT